EPGFAFLDDVSFRQARLSPIPPQDASVRSESPVFDLVASRQCSGWAQSFSLPSGRSVFALLLRPASAPVEVQCFASAPLREFAMAIRLFSSLAWEPESFPASEIDPEDSPKPRPERDSGAYGPRQRQCTQQRESRYEHASGKISAPSRERQITPAFSKSAEFCNTTLCFVSCPYYFSPLYASGHRDRHYGL